MKILLSADVQFFSKALRRSKSCPVVRFYITIPNLSLSGSEYRVFAQNLVFYLYLPIQKAIDLDVPRAIWVRDLNRVLKEATEKMVHHDRLETLHREDSYWNFDPLWYVGSS